MKLSAPPPPPPPPPGDGTSGANAPDSPDDPNNPNATTNTGASAGTPAPGALPADAPAPDAVSAPEGSPAPVVKVLQWPAWYGGVDAALVGLVLVLAFAAASFVAHNSDLWLHLAAGQRLFAGQYTPGSDPFSYSAADRAWVNHSWLVDAVSYLLYGGQGQVLVIAKAVVVALAFGLLMAIRRPNYPLWPWAAVTCVAVLAAAPQFVLRPLVVSMLFLSITLVLVFRMPHRPNSWRFPLAIGVAFWFWANSDPWFFVGPLALALLLVGELIQTKLLTPPEGSAVQEPAARPDDEPLGQPPDLLTLAKALGVGVLACMLNPHHIRVWEIPFELVGAPGVEVDPRIKQQLYAPTSSEYTSSPGLGQNLNGLAYGILLLAGAAVLGFGVGRVRAALVALWIGFAALSLFSLSAVPFFAIVAVPLVASQLNAFSARAELRGPGDQRSRLLLVGSSAGRLVCVLGVCALCVAAYPGWVHPDPPNPTAARRVAWGVEPEPALRKAAEQFHQWREKGELPADARGVVANTDLANYMAWFAPEEKVFINARYNHHRRELTDYVAVRRGLGLLDRRDEHPDPAEAAAVLKARAAEYVAIHAGPNDYPFLRTRAAEAVTAMYRNWDEWSPWYLDGRTTVFGWRPPGSTARATFSALRVDPVALAFGPNVERLPEAEPKQPLVPLGWEGPFVRPAKPTPVGAAEAIGWVRYKEGLRPRFVRRQLIRDGLIFPLVRTFPTSPALEWLAVALQLAESSGALRIPPTDPDAAADTDAAQAAPVLALRAVRRAIAEDPDHPDPYYALMKVLQDPDLPFSESERILGQVAALRQCLARLPAPENYRRGQFVANPVEVSIQLASLYLGNPIPGPAVPGAKKQQRIKWFLGVPVDVPPLNELLGQAIVVDEKRGTVLRVPFRDRGRTPSSPTVRMVSGNTSLFLALDVGRKTLEQALAYAQVEFAGEPEDEFRGRLKPIEDLLKEVETALLTANDQYTQLKTQRLSLQVLVNEALRVGLAGEALTLLTENDSSLEKEYQDQAPRAQLLRVGLEVALGRLEDADDNFKTLNTPVGLENFERTGYIMAFRALAYQKSIQAGQYKAAGELLEAMEGRAVGSEALLANIARAGVSSKLLFAELGAPPPPVFGGLLPSVAAFESLLMSYQQARNARELLSAQMRRDAEFFFRRGVLSLLEGDIEAARDRFLQARRQPPPGWQLNTLHPPGAATFLRLIERAKTRAAAH